MAAFNLMDMLGGGVTRREAPQQDSSLGQLLSFLSQSGQHQQATPIQENGRGSANIGELLGAFSKLKDNKEHEDAVAYMRNLVGTPGEARVPTPLLEAHDATPGTGMLGGQISPKDFYLQAAGSPDLQTSLAALREYGNLNATHGGRGGRSLHTAGVEGNPDQSQLGYLNENDKWVTVAPPRKDMSGLPNGFYRDPNIPNVLQQYITPTGQTVLDVKKQNQIDVKASPGFRAEDSFQLDQRKVADTESENNWRKTLEMPEKPKDAYLGNAATIKEIDKAIKEATDHPEHFGLQNILGDKASQYMDEGGVNSRAIVAGIGSVKVHEITGANATAKETPRFQPWVPEINDRPTAIVDKLKQLKAVAESKNDEIIKAYTSGYRRQPWAQPDGETPDVKVSSGSLPTNPRYGQKFTAPDGTELMYRGVVGGQPIWTPPGQGELKIDTPSPAEIKPESAAPKEGDYRINPATGKRQRWVP